MGSPTKCKTKLTCHVLRRKHGTRHSRTSYIHLISADIIGNSERSHARKRMMRLIYLKLKNSFSLYDFKKLGH